jgi:hypothetical protein
LLKNSYMHGVVCQLVSGEWQRHWYCPGIADMFLLRTAQLAHKPQQTPPELKIPNLYGLKWTASGTKANWNFDIVQKKQKNILIYNISLLFILRAKLALNILKNSVLCTAKKFFPGKIIRKKLYFYIYMINLVILI